MTVKELYNHCKNLIAKGYADKKILLSDDEEGNSYHGCYFAFTYDPQEVRECVEYSNGSDLSRDESLDDYVILG